MSGKKNIPITKQVMKTLLLISRKNYQNAIEILETPAMRNDPNAQLYLGQLYFNGDGVKKDYEKAVALWKESSRLGNELTQNNLGICYEHGYGVKKDSRKALNCFLIVNGREMVGKIQIKGANYERNIKDKDTAPVAFP